MPFNRPPRIPLTLPRESVEIPPPPALPPEPGSMNWLGILLPLSATLLMVILMLAIASGGGGGLSYIIFLPMMLAGFGVTYFSFQSQKKDFQKKLAAGKEEYARQLSKTENHLYSLRDLEQTVFRTANPDLAACLQTAGDQDPRLGERRPTDADFLSPRLGIGSLRSTIEIRPAEMCQYSPEIAAEAERAKSLAEKFARVPEVPIVGRLATTGSIGIAGKRADVMNVARSILCHLAVHHWFSEMQAAALSEPKFLAEWSWLAGLPHASKAIAWQTARIAFADPAACTVFLELERELRRRDQILEARKMVSADGAAKTPPLPALILVLDSFPLEFSHPGMDLLLKKGKALGVYALYLTSAPSLVPGECGAILEVRAGNLSYQEAAEGGISIDCRPDECDAALAESMARALAKVDWSEKEDLSQPPSMITFLHMFEAHTTEDLPIEQWWNEGSPFGFLQTPIGKTSATSEFIFDLRDQDGSHGPHGLLGGMTGSGKSEVLKSLILALAVTSHPYDVNFALVDYKGGAAFNELARLPHTVGVMTDIESHSSYAERVLLALTGEMERRKRILERARSVFRFGRSHVDDYRTMRIKQPLPHLVIVFDEFAEFKNKHPEESKRLISIARLGRSLGVHLILATQNIQAAIDPQIMQNSNFRICLRTSQPEDSVQMIGIPDAIQLVRGRAYFYSQGRSQVQIAYCGGKYGAGDGGGHASRLVVVHPDGKKEELAAPPARASAEKPADIALTEAGAIVERLNEAMQRLHLRKPDPVWSDPLPERLALPDILQDHITGGWDGRTWHPSRQWGEDAIAGADVEPPLGLCDLPQRQLQPMLQLSMDEGGGHILVFGSAGSGKSTLLKTLAISLAHVYPPSAAHIYVLDFGGQTDLKSLEALPHIGSVVSRFEPERADRLLRFAKSELKRRNEIFRKAGVSTISDYNRANGRADPLPELFFFIDNFLGLKRAFDIEYANEIASLAGGSASSGVHLAIASFSPSDLPTDLVSNVHLQTTFHQATQADYFSIVGTIPESRLQEDVGRPPRPGRGFLRSTPPIEWQAALPARGTGDQEQLQQLGEIGRQMQAAWKGNRPPAIESLPYSIPLPRAVQKGQSSVSISVPQGKDFETLQPLGFDLDKDGPAFLITSSAGQSGKTTALITWAIALAEKYTPAQLQWILIDFHSRNLTPLKKLPHTLAYINNEAEVEPCLQRVLEEMGRRAAKAEAAYHKDPDNFHLEIFLEAYPKCLILIDDYDRFAAKCETGRGLLADCYTGGGENGLAFIVAANASDLPRDYDDAFLQKVRRLGSGLLFSGNAAIDQFNNAKAPPYQPMAGLPAGRGYFIRKGQAKIFQNFMYWEEGKKPMECLLERMERIKGEAKDAPPPAWPG